MSTLKEVVVVDAVRSAIGKSGDEGNGKGGPTLPASAQEFDGHTLGIARKGPHSVSQIQ